MIARRIAVGFLVLVLAVGVCFSLNLLLESKTRGNYLLFGATGLLAVIVYLTTVLDYRITGGSVGVERAMNEVFAVRAEVVETANAMVKLSAIIADGTGRWGGFPEEHQAKVDEYIQNLRMLLSNDIDQQVEKDVSEVRALVQERMDAQAKEKT